jgi:predicted RecB family nuclease
LSPSQYHWLNYDEQKLSARFHTFRSAARGTALHALAHEAIELKIRLDQEHAALAQYVQDAIDLDMVCEQPLYYSQHCFGTPDTMCFDGQTLRIHDLKTGISKASMKQLDVYAAIFCLEYGYSPFDISIELRIYQREEIVISHPEPDTIQEVMDKIVDADRFITDYAEMQNDRR